MMEYLGHFDEALRVIVEPEHMIKAVWYLYRKFISVDADTGRLY